MEEKYHYRKVGLKRGRTSDKRQEKRKKIFQNSPHQRMEIKLILAFRKCQILRTL